MDQSQTTLVDVVTTLWAVRLQSFSYSTLHNWPKSKEKQTRVAVQFNSVLHSLSRVWLSHILSNTWLRPTYCSYGAPRSSENLGGGHELLTRGALNIFRSLLTQGGTFKAKVRAFCPSKTIQPVWFWLVRFTLLLEWNANFTFTQKMWTIPSWP